MDPHCLPRAEGRDSEPVILARAEGRIMDLLSDPGLKVG